MTVHPTSASIPLIHSVFHQYPLPDLLTGLPSSLRETFLYQWPTPASEPSQSVTQTVVQTEQAAPGGENTGQQYSLLYT